MTQPKALEMWESFVDFPFSELRGWIKRSAEARSSHCAVLPQNRHLAGDRAFIATWRFDADMPCRVSRRRFFANNFTWALTHTPGRNFLEGGVLQELWHG